MARFGSRILRRDRTCPTRVSGLRVWFGRGDVDSENTYSKSDL